MKFGHGSLSFSAAKVVRLNLKRAASLENAAGALASTALRLLVFCVAVTAITGCVACAEPPGTSQPITVTPSDVSFGNVPVGATNSQTIRITNNLPMSVTLGPLSVSGSGFRLSDVPSSLVIASDKSISFNVVFAPATVINYSSSVFVTSGGSVITSVGVSGAGVARTVSLSVSATSVSFGTENVGVKYSTPVTLKSTGNSAVTISGVAVSGTGFGVSGVANGTVLNPGQSVQLDAIFDRSVAGTSTGKITVASNATNSITIALSGSATGAQAEATTRSVSLKWNAAANATGYYVYRGSHSGGPYTRLNSAAVTAADYVDSTAEEGQTYYYAVTSVNAEGVQSSYSNQAEVSVPSTVASALDCGISPAATPACAVEWMDSNKVLGLYSSP